MVDRVPCCAALCHAMLCCAVLCCALLPDLLQPCTCVLQNMGLQYTFCLFLPTMVDNTKGGASLHPAAAMFQSVMWHVTNDCRLCFSRRCKTN